MKNSKFAKLLPDGTLKYAENMIRGKHSVIVKPSAQEYAINGYFPIEDKAPPPKKDCRWVRDKYVFDSDENKIKTVYKAIDLVIYQNCGKQVKLNWFRSLIRAIVYWCAGKQTT